MRMSQHWNRKDGKHVGLMGQKGVAAGGAGVELAFSLAIGLVYF